MIHETGKGQLAALGCSVGRSQKRGMKFAGTVIIYSYLQAVGRIESHEDGCFWDIRCKITRWQVQGKGRAGFSWEDGAMDSENANKSKKKKTSNIIQICIGVLAVVLAALIIVMMGIVSSIQGTARVVNYAGLVRGKTQRIIKLEISGQPEDGMIQDIEAVVDGLRKRQWRTGAGAP